MDLLGYLLIWVVIIVAVAWAARGARDLIHRKRVAAAATGGTSERSGVPVGDDRLQFRVGLSALGLGGLLLVAGIIVGASPITASGLRCGSAFSESTDMEAQGLASDLIGSSGDALGGALAGAPYFACQDARGSRQTTAYTLLGTGGAAVLFGVAAMSLRLEREADGYAVRRRRPVSPSS